MSRYLVGRGRAGPAKPHPAVRDAVVCLIREAIWLFQPISPHKPSDGVRTTGTYAEGHFAGGWQIGKGDSARKSLVRECEARTSVMLHRALYARSSTAFTGPADSTYPRPTPRGQPPKPPENCPPFSRGCPSPREQVAVRVGGSQRDAFQARGRRGIRGHILQISPWRKAWMGRSTRSPLASERPQRRC
jgi:hypothetical protein